MLHVENLLQTQHMQKKTQVCYNREKIDKRCNLHVITNGEMQSQTFARVYVCMYVCAYVRAHVAANKTAHLMRLDVV